MLVLAWAEGDENAVFVEEMHSGLCIGFVESKLQY